MKSAARLKECLSTPLERIRTYDASTPGGSVRAWLSPAAPIAPVRVMRQDGLKVLDTIGGDVGGLRANTRRVGGLAQRCRVPPVDVADAQLAVHRCPNFTPHPR
jgi:hypothetical protein